MNLQFFTETGGDATFVIFNLNGNPMMEAAMGTVRPGYHEETIELSHFPGGIFFLRTLVGQQFMHSQIVIP
jgi:hypothetical protein